MNNLYQSRLLHALATRRKSAASGKTTPVKPQQRPYLDLLSAVLGRPVEEVVVRLSDPRSPKSKSTSI